MIIKYHKSNNSHNITLSGKVDDKDKMRVKMLIDQILEIKPGCVKNLQLDCSGVELDLLENVNEELIDFK